MAELNSLGEVLIEELDGENTTGLAVDSAGEVFLDNGTGVALFSAKNAQVETFGTGVLEEGTGIAVNSKTGNVYVADAGSSRIDIFVPEPPAKPQIDELSVSSTAASSVTLNAEINPTGADTNYAFRYSTAVVPTAAEECTGACVQLPSSDIGAGFGDVAARDHVQGLAPHTTYHYRVVAKNSFGEIESTEGSFTTQSAVSGPTLPDGRQWQVVSPQNKNGAGIEPMTEEGGLIEASENGSSVTYLAQGAFEGAEGNRSPEYSQILARRGSTEWSSRDLSTPYEKGEGLLPGASPEYQFFSTDLSQALVVPFGHTQFEQPPLTKTATERTPYVRQNGSCEAVVETCYTPLVTSSNVPAGTHFGGAVSFLDATSDLGHRVLESAQPLTSEPAAAGSNLYESDSAGHLQLINVLPGGTTPAHEAKLGDNNFAMRNAISSDGSRVFWTSYQQGTSLHLYMRAMTRGAGGNRSRSIRLKRASPSSARSCVARSSRPPTTVARGCSSPTNSV